MLPFVVRFVDVVLKKVTVLEAKVTFVVEIVMVAVPAVPSA